MSRGLIAKVKIGWEDQTLIIFNFDEKKGFWSSNYDLMQYIRSLFNVDVYYISIITTDYNVPDESFKWRSKLQ